MPTGILVDVLAGDNSDLCTVTPCVLIRETFLANVDGGVFKFISNSAGFGKIVVSVISSSTDDITGVIGSFSGAILNRRGQFAGLRITDADFVFVHPLGKVTVTLYDPAAVASIQFVVAPVDHE